MRKSPVTIETARIYLLSLLKYLRKVLIPSEVSKKGMARPAEYATKRAIPDHADSEVAATAKMAERIGPIHGVHPAAKPIPTRKEPSMPDGFSLKKWSRLSRCKILKLITPIIWIPSTIIIIPPILRTISWYSMKTLPRSWADEPRITTKTVVKPRINIMEFNSMTFLRFLPSSSVNSSNEIPVTNEIYDGTNGRTHGEIKERIPPKKANGIETSVVK